MLHIFMILEPTSPDDVLGNSKIAEALRKVHLDIFPRKFKLNSNNEINFFWEIIDLSILEWLLER